VNGFVHRALVKEVSVSINQPAACPPQALWWYSMAVVIYIFA